MKKTLLLASVFAVGAALATDFGSANALGVLQVSGSSKPKRVLLSVPFAGYGKDADGKDAKIKVSELVETSTLPEDTVLRVACEGGYYTWKLTADKKWDPVNDEVVSIDANGEQDQNKDKTPDADTVEIGRGNSFWLELPEPNGEVMYTLIGQQDLSGTGVALTGKKWNLVGNPNVSGEYDVASKISGLRQDGDSISVQNTSTGLLKTYRYNGTKEKWVWNRIGWDDVKIQPGDGCWVYVNSDATLNFFEGE